MFPTSILPGSYGVTSGGGGEGGGEGGGSPFTGPIFGYNYTHTPVGTLSVYEDWWQNGPGLTAVGTPYYYISFGPGMAANSQERALNYVKDLVSWLTDTPVNDVATSTNYTLSTADFTRLTLGTGGTNGDGNFSSTFAYFEPAAVSTYISLEEFTAIGREYAIRFYGGWTVSSGINDGTVGASSVPVQYWKKTT